MTDSNSGTRRRLYLEIGRSGNREIGNQQSAIGYRLSAIDSDLHHALEDVDDSGVELRAGATIEFEQRLARRDRVAEDARPRHRVVGVGDGDDARAERDVERGR